MLIVLILNFTHEEIIMLRRFNVKNFMSFDTRLDGKSEEFSMIPGKVRNKPEHVISDGNAKTLKFAAVYGANASGKSNFVKALDCMRQIIASGTTTGFTDKYCRIKEDNRNLPSYFEVEIIIDSKVYSYGFEVILNESKFLSEWLYELQPDGEDMLIFERDISNSIIKLKKEWESNSELEKFFSVYSLEMAADSQSLFLRYMNGRDKVAFYNYNSFPDTSILRTVYQWFFFTINITFPSNAVGYSYFVNSGDLSKATEIIAAFGTGIFKCVQSPLQLEEFYKILPKEIGQQLINDIESSKLRVLASTKAIKTNIVANVSGDLYMVSIDKRNGSVCNKIEFIHSYNGHPYSFGEESDGTQRLWELLDLLLSTEDETYVIDEIDRCLHPSLTYKFVETFFRFAENTKKQLIVTTHESRLMDFDLLRRDEVWFTDKRKTGETDMYSLEEFNERFDKKIDKAYLDGRYGGVPLFTTIFPIVEEQ